MPHKISKAFNTPLKKRLAVGAVSVLTAGALIGVGVEGASAAPLSSAAASTATPSTNAPTHTGRAFIGSLKKEIRADLIKGHDVGEKAQLVAATVSGHKELFQKLPANLQADVTTLKDASASERTADALKIKATALSGGYGKDIQKVAAAVKKNPKHPLAAALRAELRGGLEHGKAAQSAEKITTTLLDHPKLFAQLPANLQADLTTLKNAPAAEKAADAQKTETTAINGGYGPQIQKFAEKIQAGANVKAGQ